MDHYTTLGVSRDATQDEIKKAYRKLAMSHHPDKGGDITKFQEITNAYETLGDPTKRSAYDNPRGPAQFNAGNGGFEFNINDFFMGDMFAQAFGQAFGQHRENNFNQQHTPVYRTRVSISLVDAYNGAEHVLHLSTEQGVKILNIKIPQGTNTGDQLRFNNAIDKGILIVDFVVQADHRFDRDGNHLLMNCAVSVLDLIVGTKIEVTTISGKKLEVIIPPGCQPNRQIRLAGHGMISQNGSHGDQILLLKPIVPENIDDELTDAINKFRDRSSKT